MSLRRGPHINFDILVLIARRIHKSGLESLETGNFLNCPARVPQLFSTATLVPQVLA